MFAVGRAFAVLLASLFMFSGPDVAHAAESENSIIISVQNQANTNGVSEKKPVVGVKVSVANLLGLAIGEGVTDSSGSATIPVPAKDDYVVTLDVASPGVGGVVQAATSNSQAPISGMVALRGAPKISDVTPTGVPRSFSEGAVGRKLPIAKFR